MWPWSSKSKEQPAVVHDHVLGELRFSDDHWSGSTRRDAFNLDVSIVGDARGPIAPGRELAIDALNRIGELVAGARAYLVNDMAPEDLARGPYEFRPTGIWSGAAWQLKQRSITLTLEMEGDPDGLWRVEIGPDGPLDSGRDS